jgi:chromosome partitioning protein
VLTIDCDQQANLTISLGVDPLSVVGQTVRELLVDDALEADQVIIQTQEGVDLIPSNIDLAMVEFAMSPIARERVLARKLVGVQSQYDFILIDTPPTFGTTVINAMGASDYALVPVQPEPLCIYGLSQLTQSLQRVRRDVNPRIELLGLFVTLYEPVAAHIGLTERLRQDWPDYLFKTIIRDRAINDRAVLEGRAIVSIRPKSDLALDYQALTDEVLSRVNQ